MANQDKDTPGVTNNNVDLANSKGKAKVEERDTTMHLDRDPNDPRRVPNAEPNLSKLNEEDPEVSPSFQNPLSPSK